MSMLAETSMTVLAERLEQVKQDVAEAALKAGRNPADVTIIAVSKSVDRATVDAAYALGQRHFGENRVQDTQRRFTPPLPADATLHMIGQLQSNKASIASSLFQMIHSVDRMSLVEALAKAGSNREVPIPVLLQVNIAGEEQKAGCDPAIVTDLVSLIVQSPGLILRGFMTIAPLADDMEATRPVFRGLRELRDRIQDANPVLDLAILSMGMTNDFPVAVAEGATHLRVGRAIFG